MWSQGGQGHAEQSRRGEAETRASESQVQRPSGEVKPRQPPGMLQSRASQGAQQAGAEGRVAMLPLLHTLPARAWPGLHLAPLGTSFLPPSQPLLLLSNCVREIQECSCKHVGSGVKLTWL